MISPLRILLLTLAIVFVADVVIMFLLHVLMPGSHGPAKAENVFSDLKEGLSRLKPALVEPGRGNRL